MDFLKASPWLPVQQALCRFKELAQGQVGIANRNQLSTRLANAELIAAVIAHIGLSHYALIVVG